MDELLAGPDTGTTQPSAHTAKLSTGWLTLGNRSTVCLRRLSLVEEDLRGTRRCSKLIHFNGPDKG